MFLWTAFLGWLAALLLGAGISVPYLARGSERRTLLPHYAIGLILPAVATAHAWLPMSRMPIRSFDMTGLLLATGALLLMIWQAGLGLALLAAREAGRRKVVRLHFGTMLAVTALVTGHILLDRA